MEKVTKIANYFIHLSRATGSLLTNLKLQKLLYFVQGWHLALFKKPLFKDDIEAWDYTPIVENIYNKYKKYQCNPITEKVNRPFFNKKTYNFLKEFSEVFFYRDAYELELMIHQELPWQNTKKRLTLNNNSSNIITHEDMQKYFTSLIKK